MEIQARLGAVIRTFRSRLGITQEELAWRANLHRTYIAGVERGVRNATLRSVANLANALQITVGALFSEVAAPSEPAGGNAAGSAPKRSREILLIEDNPADATMAMRAFRRAKLTNPLRIVSEAEEGLAYLFGTGRLARRRITQPELILLDLNLPRMSGLEFLRRIKGDKRTRNIPVVVLTVSQSDRNIIECGRLGAANYIVKPVAIESLVCVTPKLNLSLTLGEPRIAGKHRHGS